VEPTVDSIVVVVKDDDEDDDDDEVFVIWSQARQQTNAHTQTNERRGGPPKDY
jgi:hypothetical protein